MEKRKRFAGVLAHITSLPSHNGIGDMGKECTNAFISFLQRINHTAWSILPLHAMGDDYCPYNTRSTFGGSLEHICVDDLGVDSTPPSELLGDPSRVNFKAVTAFKRRVLWEAFKSSKDKLGADYQEFKKSSEWLNDYCVFMVVGEVNGNNYEWSKWKPEGLRRHEPAAIAEFEQKHADLVEFHRYVQFIFFQQLADLKRRVNEAGIMLLGDLACYMNYQSVDVWAHKELFEIDPVTLKTVLCSGVTADMFSEYGQWWGHPVYRWQDNKKPVIDWWIQRLRHNTKYFDMLRIDHALGLVSYCCMPYKDNPNDEERKALCAKGKWQKSVGDELFQDPRLGEAKEHIFFEDRGPAGEIEKVGPVRERGNFPGMASFQDAFGPGGNKSCMIHNLYKNCYFYLGTHDDLPIRDYLSEARPESIKHLKEYFGMMEKDGVEKMYETALRSAYTSVADGVIVQMQDVLPYKKGSRMNVPGVPFGQWVWRFTEEELRAVTPEDTRMFQRLVSLYERGGI